MSLDTVHHRQTHSLHLQTENDKISLDKTKDECCVTETTHIPCLWLACQSSSSMFKNQSKNHLAVTEFNAPYTNMCNKNLLSEENTSFSYNLTTMINQNFDKLRNMRQRKNTKIMLFFHGNAEDLGLAHAILTQIKNKLKITILAVEYSGYGLYEGEKSADLVLNDCLLVYDYMTKQLGVAEEDIILFGRSIGSSPSCFIAKERPAVGCMILMSPFKSLRDIAKDRVGKLLSYLLADRYRNIDLIRSAKCPVLIIHGQADSIVDVSHSIALKDNCVQSAFSKLITPEHMDHNNFKF